MQKTNTSIKLCSIMDIMGCVVRCRASLPRCLAPQAPNPSVTLAPQLQVGRTSTAQFGQQKSTTEIHMIHFCKGLCQNVSNRQATNAHRSCERYAIHWRSSRRGCSSYFLWLWIAFVLKNHEGTNMSIEQGSGLIITWKRQSFGFPAVVSWSCSI